MCVIVVCFGQLLFRQVAKIQFIHAIKSTSEHEVFELFQLVLEPKIEPALREKAENLSK